MRRRLVTVTLAWVAVVAALAPLAQAQERGLTPELILTIRQATDAVMSPDGRHVALQISRPREAGASPGGAVNEVWLVPSAGGDPVQLTTNEEGSRAPQWSPDGGQLAFLSRRAGSEFTQVYLLPMRGGEARRLTNARNSVVAFKWSPDGQWLAYTVTDPKTAEEREAERQGRDWVVADQNYKHIRLHAINVGTGESHVVTTSAVTVHDFDWAPDSERLVLAAADTPLVDDSYMKLKIMSVPRAGAAPTLVVSTEGKLTHPRWSPDGRWIAWLGATELADPYAGRVYVVASGGGAVQAITPDYQGTATWLSWLPGSPDTITFVGIEGQYTRAYTITLPARAMAPIPIGDPILLAGLSFSADGRLVAFPASTPSHPFEAYVAQSASGSAPRRVTMLNPQLEGVQFGEQEIVRWTSVDGRTMEGVIVKPVGYQSGRGYPLVMQPHGGPEAADLNGWYGSYSRWGQMLAGRGFVTFYPNYRGSIGRGPAFSMADHRDLMGLEFQDMLSGIEHLANIGLVDRERVGVGGGSYGGYTSAWAATYGSEHFRAAVMWMGISNWYSMTGTSDIFFENSTVHWNAMMYEHEALYWDRSPLAHIDKANTPTLIVHGAADPRVPIGQSEEMYMALKWKGVPVEFVTYPREGHGVAERAHQDDFMRRVLNWFETHLKASTDAEP